MAGFLTKFRAGWRSATAPAPEVERAPAVRSELTEYSELLQAFKAGVFGEYGVSRSGTPVTRREIAGLAAVEVCIRILCESIAHLPGGVFRRNASDKTKSAATRERLDDHPVYKLLFVQPNEWQTAYDLKELWVQDLELEGNAYGLVVRGLGRRPIEILRLHPHSVDVKQDQTTLKLSYEYTRPDGRRVTLSPREVIHFRGRGDDGVKGISRIQRHREILGDAVAMSEYGSRFYSNGAKPLGVLEWDTPQGVRPEMGKEAKDDLKNDMMEAYSGGANSHKTLVLPWGLKYKAVSISPKDAMYIEGRKFSRGEIFSIFGIPPHMGGDLERATFSNIEHLAIEYVQNALIPRLVRMEQVIQRDLLVGEEGVYVRFNVDGLLRGDFKSRQEGLQIQRRNGVINPNQWRAKEELDPREDAGGEAYLVESAMRPDDGKEPKQPAKSGSGDNSREGDKGK